MVSELSSDRAWFPPSSVVLSVSAGWLFVFDSDALGATRWLEKPPDPSAVMAQEPKTTIVPQA